MSSRLSLIIYGFRRVWFNKCRFVREREWNSSIHHISTVFAPPGFRFHFIPPFLRFARCSPRDRSIGFFLFRSFVVHFFFLFFSSSGESREIRRIKNHECISQTGFPKSEPINGADDLTRFEFHLNNVQIKPHHTLPHSNDEATEDIRWDKKKRKREIEAGRKVVGQTRDRRVLSCESCVARRIPQLWCDRHRAPPATPDQRRGINHARWPFDIFTTGDELW